MKTLKKRFLVYLLVAAMTIGLLPGSVLAVETGGDKVLTAIEHTDAAAKVNAAGKTALTLTVPYAHKGGVELDRGLTLSYDKNAYPTVVAQFPDGATAEVDGAPVRMVVAYQKKGGDVLLETEYSVAVVRAKRTAPKFSGTIAKSVSVPGKATFASADFTAKYAKNDGQGLAAIAIEGTIPAFGTLKLNGREYEPGSTITLSDIERGRLIFEAADEGEVSYVVSAFDAEDKAKEVGTAVLTIKAQRPAAEDIKLTTAYGKEIALKSADFNTVCKKVTANTLKYVTFTLPSASAGTLYFYETSSKRTAVKAGEAYNLSGDPAIADVRFVPKDGYSGTVTVGYKAYDTKGISYSGKLLVTVEAKRENIISYSSSQGAAVKFSVADFNTACKNELGTNLDYVKFTLPSTSAGKLYYGYSSASDYDSLVTASKKYYRSKSPDIASVSFVPKDGYEGTLTLAYTGYDTNGDSYAGKVQIKVTKRDASVLTYTLAGDKALEFSGTEFNNICREVLGTNLSYVKFTLPSSSDGKLYYNYTASGDYDSAVSSSTKYYRSSTPSISNVSFVPKSGTSGKVTISYTGYIAGGDSYQGKIIINVTQTDDATTTYSTSSESAVEFSASDLNTACREATGSSLSYVKFTLPSSSDGKLYYNYTASGDYDAAVSSSTKYYRSGTPSISNVSFVPKSGTSGKVTLTYKGYATDGESYTGKIIVNVAQADESTVTYSVSDESYIEFSSTDFNNACREETGASLSYVKFTLPSSSDGKLYYNYTASGDYDAAVSSSTKYYRSSTPSISNVSFVPKSGTSGKVTLTYKGYATDGESYTGKIIINVGQSDSDAIRYETSSGKAVTFDAAAFNTVCREELGANLSYVKFTLPSSSDGKLYYNYTSSGDYDAAVSSSTKYYRSGDPSVSDVSFVPKAGTSGKVEIAYKGYDTTGDSYAGTVIITVKKAAAAKDISYSVQSGKVLTFDADDFSEVCRSATGETLSYVKFSLPSSSDGKLYYNYKSATDYGQAVSSSTKYYRNSSPYLSSVSFVPSANAKGKVTIPYTAWDADGNEYDGNVVIKVRPKEGKSEYFIDITVNFYWAGPAVDYLYENSISMGIGGNQFSPQTNITRGDFMLMLYRAFGLKGGKHSGDFADVPRSSYYYEAISAAKDLGIAQGHNNRFMPTSALTREDAMVLITRTLEVAGKAPEKGKTSSLAAFSDRGSISSYAEVSVATLVKAGIVQGDNGKIRPKSSITRAEMAALLYRILAE